MYDNDSKGISYTAGFFMLIAFTVAGLFIASLIGIALWTTMTGLPILEMDKALSNPSYSNFARVFQTITAIISFFVPALVTAAMLNRRPLRLLGYSPGVKLKQVALVILIMIAALIVSLALLFQQYHPSS
jgi:hypothetical protein